MRLNTNPRAAEHVRIAFQFARRVMTLFALFGAGGCVNLPPALEREFECPAPDAPDNFGSAATCVQPDGR